MALAYMLAHTGYYQIPAGVVCVTPSVASYVVLLADTRDYPAFAFLFTGVLLSSVLLGRRHTILIALLNITGLLLLPVLRPAWSFEIVAGAITFHTIFSALLVTTMRYRDTLEHERRRELTESELKFRSIFETSGVSIWEEDFSAIKVELDHLRQQGVVDFRAYFVDHPEVVHEMTKLLKVIDVNHFTLQLYGAKDKDVFFAALDRIFELEDPAGFREELISLAEGQPYHEGEVKDRSLSGDPLYLWRTIVFPKENSKFNSVLVCLTDITAHRQTEIVLRQSEERYRKLINNARDVIFTISVDGKITSLNPSFEMFTGWAREEWLGRDLEELILKKDHDRALTQFRKILLGETLRSFRLEIYSSSGETLVMEMNLSAQYEDDQVIGWRGIAREGTLEQRTMDALQASQERLQLFFNQSLDGFFFSMLDEPREWNDEVDKESVIDYAMTHQHVTEVNDAMLRQYGSTREKFLGRTASDFFAHDLVQARQLRRSLFDAGHLFLDTEERKDDGTPIWIEGDYVCMYDEQGCISGMFGIQRDVSQRKQTEMALRESEARFSKIFHVSPIGINIFELSNNCSVDVNEAYLEVVGYARNEIVGHTAEELNLFLNMDDRNTKVDEVRRVGYVHDWDAKIRKKSGEIRDVILSIDIININGRAMGLVVMLDITERKLVEKKLNETTQFLESIIASSPVAIISYDVDGYVQAWNPAAESVFGWKAEEVIGQIAPHIGNENLPQFHALRQRVLQGETLSDVELKRWRKDGIPITVNLSTAPRIDETGNLTGYLAIISDITERKRAMEERETLIEELSAKNAELERFVYTVSHDLRSPLVTMKGFLGYLEQDALSGNMERLRNDSQRISNAVEKMQELLNGLLELSRIGRFVNPSEMISFETLARDAIELVDGQIQQLGVAIDLQVAPTRIYGDKLRLLEVMQNLLDNALKFMGAQPEPRIEIGVIHEQSGRVVFYVKDNGIGIAPDYRDQIFGLFNQLDSHSTGTGIGLALVKRIIEFHEGDIWLESEPGVGSTFFFTLPSEPKSESGL